MNPVTAAGGAVDVYGMASGSWIPLGQWLADIGAAIPSDCRGARITTHADMSYCHSADAVAANPSITPMRLPTNGALELFEATQVGNLMILDDGAQFFTIQFYT